MKNQGRASEENTARIKPGEKRENESFCGFKIRTLSD